MSAVITESEDFIQPAKQLSADFDTDEITKNLNDYYSQEVAEIDPVILKMAALSLPKDKWEFSSAKS